MELEVDRDGDLLARRGLGDVEAVGLASGVDDQPHVVGAPGVEADNVACGIGGAVECVERAGIEPVQACTEGLKRTCEAVNLLLMEAGKLSMTQACEGIPTNNREETIVT